MIRRIALLSAILVVLTACQSSTDNGNAPAAGASDTAGIATPGSLPISVERATQLFTDLCAQQAPFFSGTVAIAIAHGFAPNPFMGTYFHPTENLSITARDGICSMVFASDADRQELQDSLIPLVPEDMSVVFGPRRFASGNEYYAISIGPQPT